MSKLSTAARRIFLGQPFRSDKLAHTLLSKRIALPVFASDALSSVAYAPEEIFLVLSVAGLTAYSMAPWIGLAVAAVMLVVIASYRQNVHAYPSGGGDYEVAHRNLGEKAGLIVAIFMHMAWERLTLIYAILIPPALLLVFIAIMAVESDYTHWLRELFFRLGT